MGEYWLIGVCNHCAHTCIQPPDAEWVHLATWEDYMLFEEHAVEVKAGTEVRAPLCIHCLLPILPSTQSTVWQHANGVKDHGAEAGEVPAGEGETGDVVLKMGEGEEWTGTGSMDGEGRVAVYQAVYWGMKKEFGEEFWGRWKRHDA